MKKIDQMPIAPPFFPLFFSFFSFFFSLFFFLTRSPFSLPHSFNAYREMSRIKQSPKHSMPGSFSLSFPSFLFFSFQNLLHSSGDQLKYMINEDRTCRLGRCGCPPLFSPLLFFFLFFFFRAPLLPPSRSRMLKTIKGIGVKLRWD